MMIPLKTNHYLPNAFPNQFILYVMMAALGNGTETGAQDASQVQERRRTLSHCEMIRTLNAIGKKGRGYYSAKRIHIILKYECI